MRLKLVGGAREILLQSFCESFFSEERKNHRQQVENDKKGQFGQNYFCKFQNIFLPRWACTASITSTMQSMHITHKPFQHPLYGIKYCFWNFLPFFAETEMHMNSIQYWDLFHASFGLSSSFPISWICKLLNTRFQPSTIQRKVQ